MTDNEIIKALECCIGRCDCCECPAIGVCRHDHDCPKTIALDLINRQKAEIERMEKHELQEAMKFNNDTINRSANEAVKEFAERFKGVLIKNFSLPTYFILSEKIDNILKEMGVEG